MKPISPPLSSRVLAGLIAFAIAAAASAQSFPNRPIRLIVPFPAGGPSDLFARVLGQGMSTQLGQPVVVENRAGAGGTIGVDAAAKAPPDGHVLTLNSASSVAMAPFTMQSLPYDPRKDLAYITLVVKVPEVLVIGKGVQANTVADLVAYARANPGKLNYGSAGSGTITHFGVELLKVAAKVDMVHVPYKGAAPAVADLVAGQVQLGVFDVPVVAPHIRSGAIRALAVTSDKRAPTLPEVPSMVEAGYPTVNSDNWYGLVAAAATPPDVLKRLHTVATTTLRSKELAEQYAKVSGIPSPTTPEEYYAYMESEAKKWGAVIRAIGFKAEQ